MTDNPYEKRLSLVEKNLEALQEQNKISQEQNDHMLDLTEAVKELGGDAGTLVEVVASTARQQRDLATLRSDVDVSVTDAKNVSIKSRRKFTVLIILIAIFSAGLYTSNTISRINACNLRNDQSKAQSEFILGLVQLGRNDVDTPSPTPASEAVVNQFLSNSTPLDCSALIPFYAAD